ncbi:MAG TPA: hypothetical protein DHV96_05105 [Lachnospiraceae bacterium]|nr:hypothetical protein [Lachnospiraceae bacterium]
MGSQTKIVVVKAKELIYTGIFLVLGILFVILLITMFGKGKNKDSASAQKYVPGVYSSTITLGENTLNVSVAVDEDTVSGVSIENLNETVTTMYPLLEPALNEINSQISVVDNVDDITYSKENQYTYIILNQAIKNALEQASTPQ